MAATPNRPARPRRDRHVAAATKEGQRTPNAQLVLVGILLWVGAIHTSGLFGAFVLDDKGLLQDPSLLDFAGFEWFRLTGRPVTMGTFAINFTLFGPTPTSCHVVNIAIHLASVACLFALVQRTVLLLRPQLDAFLPVCIAASVALVWGVHPLCTAAVTYIVQRAESLASLGMLLAVFAWSRAFAEQHRREGAQRDRSASRWRWAVLSILAAYLAYGSKQNSAGLPLIILLYDRVFIAQSWRQIAARTGWYLLLVAPLIVAALLIMPQLLDDGGGRRTAGFALDRLTPWAYFTSQPIVFLRYLGLAILPVNLSLDYGWLPPREPAIQMLGFVGWFVLAVGIVFLWFRSRSLAMILLAALIVLAPTSTFLPLQDIIFEHRFYLPLACLIAAAFGWYALRRNGDPNRDTTTLGWRMLAVACAVAIPLSWLTCARNLDYTSPARIHAVDTRHHPNNPRAWYALATTAHFDRPGPKIEMLQRAIKLSQDRDFFYAGTDFKWPRDLADTMFLSGQVSQSRQWYEMALPNSYDDLQRTEIIFRLAMIASMEARHEQAEELFQQALAGHPKIRSQIEQVYQAHRARTAAKTTAMDDDSMN